MKYYCGLILCVLFMSACGSDVIETEDKNPDGDPTDYCEVFGWYGDGKCDENCINPDPDCDTLSCDIPGEGFYVSEDAPNCQNLRYGCPDTMEQFVNDCGCGCIETEVACAGVLGGDGRNYYSYGEACEFDDFVCEPGTEYFSDDCGCGCTSAGECAPQPDDAFYYGTNEEECSQELARPSCPDGFESFNDGACGCGCAPADSCIIDDSVIYYGYSEEECSLENVRPPECPQGFQEFENSCGCGCEPINECPSGPGVSYVSTNVDECQLIDFDCGPNSQNFYDDACGCGCIDDDNIMCEYNDPELIWVSTDGESCAFEDWGCPEDYTVFANSCGCGCKPSECQIDSDCPNGFCQNFDAANYCEKPYCGDGTQIQCRAMEPICPVGETFSVVNGCYGPCVDARSCM